MALTQNTTPADGIDPERPYRNAPLSRLVEQVEFAYTDNVCPDFYVMVELVRRAEAAEVAQ